MLNACSPTTGLCTLMGTPVARTTRSDSAFSRARSTPVSSPRCISEATANSSSGTWPASSPSPLTVVWTTDAPPTTAAMAFGTAIEAWLWQWT